VISGHGVRSSSSWERPSIRQKASFASIQRASEKRTRPIPTAA
jgi:hypothetical protein